MPEKRKRVMVPAQPEKPRVLGIAWYRQDQWELLRMVADDRDNLELTHAEWERNAEQTLQRLTDIGVFAVKVDIDMEEFLAWADQNDQPVTAASRVQYTAETLRKLISNGEPNDY